MSGRIAVWYLPPAGAERSYLSRAGAILRRASLFRPSPVGPWLYVLILLVVLPGLALAAVRCLAVAVGRGKSTSARRTAAWLFAIAALNFALLGADHTAVSGARRGRSFRLHPVAGGARAGALAEPDGAAGALVERGEHWRWKTMSFFTDHQVGDTRAPWVALAQTRVSPTGRRHPPELV